MMRVFLGMAAAMLCTAAAAAAAAAPAPAAAGQIIYKCAVDGHIAYSQAPCPAGAASASVLAVPAAPSVDPSAAAELARQKIQAAALEKARLKQEAKDEREQDRTAQAAATRQKKCGKLQLNKKWADDDVKNATIETADHARTRAKRAADALALECPK